MAERTAKAPRDAGVEKHVSNRQCWQFGVFPIRVEGNELVMATTPGHLPRALRFASSVLERPAYFVLPALDALAQALGQPHALPGLDASHLASTALAA